MLLPPPNPPDPPCLLLLLAGSRESAGLAPGPAALSEARSVSGRPAGCAWAGGCPGSQGCRPGRWGCGKRNFSSRCERCVGGGCLFPARPGRARQLSVQIGG